MLWLLLTWSCGKETCMPDDILGDGIDHNCDGYDGVGAEATNTAAYFADRDQDGFGDPKAKVMLSAPKEGFVENADDCDDGNDSVYPDAAEICDGIDNSCNGLIDAEDEHLDILTTIRMYEDQDQDGYGALDKPIFACEQTSKISLSNTDCNDENPEIRPSQGCGGCFWGECDHQFILSNTALDFVEIPSGSFLLGSPLSEAAHEAEEQEIFVDISYPYYMMTTPITQGMYAEVMGENPAMFGPNSGYVAASEQCGLDCPMETVSWYQAAEFANRLTARWNQAFEDELLSCYQCLADVCTPQYSPAECSGFRLPTEAEWEYAARAGTTAPFWTQNSNGALPDQYLSIQGCQRDWMLEDGSQLADYAWFCANNIGNFGDPLYGPKPVALKQPNGFGLFDMAGGIWEMTTDAYLEQRSQAMDPYYPPESSVVRKGGMWGDPPSDLRAARREPVGVNYKNGDVGFRLVRTR